jgi:hypothetical protein
LVNKSLQAAEELDNRLKKETKSSWKDNATSVLRKEVATRSRRRENSRVLNQQTQRSDYIYETDMIVKGCCC